MSFKACSFLVILCLASFQITSSTIIDERGLLQDLIDKAKEVLKQLTETVKNAVSKASEVLKDLQNTIQKLAEDAINAAKKQINEIIAKAKDTIQKIIDQATGSGINIKECMKYVDELDDLPKKLIDNEIKCVTSEVQTGLKIITDATNTIQKIYDGVTGLPTRLQDCLNEPLSAIKCVIGVINDMIEMETTVPIEITQEVRRAIEFVSGFKVRVEKCAVDQVANAQKEVGRIIADMTKCVINHKPEYIVQFSKI